MLRNDGDYMFYRLQVWSPPEPAKKVGSTELPARAGHWLWPNFDHFGYPPGFQASDSCWQKIGEHGVFDEQEGRTGLVWISGKHPERLFRLVKVTISQKTEPGIVMGNYPLPSFQNVEN